MTNEPVTIQSLVMEGAEPTTTFTLAPHAIVELTERGQHFLEA